MKNVKFNCFALITASLISFAAYAEEDAVKVEKTSDENKKVELKEAGVDTGSVTLDINVPVLNKAPYFEDNIYARRLDSITKDIQLDYNSFVQSYIDLYAFRQRRQVERMLGLADYYFPMVEKVFKEQKIPTEFKYLAIVESALNPYAVSRVGATGMWQFMFTTAKMYGLKITSHIDERRDPYKATLAASKYFKDMYARYGDWLLVIAAYNCGPGNVNKAIKRSGGKRTFWEIRDYLPAETRGYVPAYIAATYIMNFADEHNLYATYPNFSFETDTVHFSSPVAFRDIESFCGVTEAELRTLNPLFKKDFVPAFDNETFAVCIPATRKQFVLSLKDTLYKAFPEALQNENVLVLNTDPSAKPRSIIKTHVVRKGETLTKIAAKYGVSVAEMRKWNRMKNNTVWAGQRLKIHQEAPATSTYAQSKQSVTPVKKQQNVSLASNKSKPEFEKVKQTVTKMHKVKSGENITMIANRYKVGVDDIRRWNNLKSSRLLVGQSLKIRKVEEILVAKKAITPNMDNNAIASETKQAINSSNDEVEIAKVPVNVAHTVKRGETLTQIAGRYNVSLDDLKAWNNLKSSNIMVGQKLSVKQMEDKVVVKNAGADNASTLVSSKTSKVPVRNEDTKYVFYKVEPGDTLWSIAKRYEGMTVEKIRAMNGLKTGQEIKAGMVLKISPKG